MLRVNQGTELLQNSGSMGRGVGVNVSCVNECVLPCCPAEDLPNLSFYSWFRFKSSDKIQVFDSFAIR